MNSKTKKTFLEFNTQLQRELAQSNPELQKILDESNEKKSHARWSSCQNQHVSLISWKEKILNALSIDEVLEYYGFPLNWQHRRPCMFHNGKDDNFSAYGGTKYHCFVCGESGDLITFVMKYFNLSFREALVKLDHDFKLGVTGEKITVEKRISIKKAIEIRHDLEEKHALFREYYRHLETLHRVLFRIMDKYKCKDPDEPSENWHPLFVDAVIRVPRIEWFLDEYVDVYADIALFGKYIEEWGLPNEHFIEL